MKKYSDEQLEKACANYVDNWDIETLITYAQENLYAYFRGKTVDAEELQNFMAEYYQ